MHDHKRLCENSSFSHPEQSRRVISLITTGFDPTQPDIHLGVFTQSPRVVPYVIIVIFITLEWTPDSA